MILCYLMQRRCKENGTITIKVKLLMLLRRPILCISSWDLSYTKFYVIQRFGGASGRAKLILTDLQSCSTRKDILV